MRKTFAVLCVCSATLSCGAAAATAVPITKATQVRGLTLGFSGGADGALAGSVLTQDFWVPRAKKEDAQMVRLDVAWSQIAPATPATGFDASNPSDAGYRWAQLDEQVRELAAEHFEILITIAGAPEWAEGPNMPKTAAPGTWEPNPIDFGEFAKAIATRYDGIYPDPLDSEKSLPRVADWQAWDEPNIPDHLSPEWTGSSTAGYQAESPGIYRQLENAFYPAIKAVSKSNYVVLAGLGPYGDEPGTTSTARMPPVEFERDLLCVTVTFTEANGCSGPTYFDAIDSHPYGIYGPNAHALDADDVSIPDVVKLVRVLNASEKMHTAMPSGAKGNWVTETSWDTDPPDPNGVPIQEQARWVNQATYNLWKQGVSTVLWWQIVDSPPNPSYAATYQAGVYFLSGAAKPSAKSFRMPFVAWRKNYKTVVTWTRSPLPGVASIQEKTRSGWLTLARVRTKASEVFEVPVHLIFKETLRVKIGNDVSLPWAQSG